MTIKLDKFDYAIIDLLKQDGRMTLSTLANNVGLSKSPCQSRVKRLEKEGIIIGYQARINYAKLDIEHIAFIQVTLTDTHTKALNEFNRAIKEIPEAEECHMMASSFDYLIKVRTKNMASYRLLLGETISNLPFVAQTSTFVVMENVKE